MRCANYCKSRGRGGLVGRMLAVSLPLSFFAQGCLWLERGNNLLVSVR